MALVLEVSGTVYATFEAGELPAVGQIVGIPDGRAAEVMAVIQADGPFFTGTLVTVRPWDSDVCRDLSADDVYPWIEA